MNTVITKRPTGIARFTAAQSRTYPQVVREIKRGVKESHWMWFIFPQHRGLAKSETAWRFGITGMDEARAYFDNALLRARLFECTMGVLAQRRLMFGDTDQRKLRACMTLFRTVAPDPAPMNAVLTKFFGGVGDPRTIDILEGRTTVPEVFTMGRHWEKQIARAQAVVAAAGQRRETSEPWNRTRVTSFVRGFGLSQVAARQLVDAWMADQGKARAEGYDEGWSARENW